MTIPRHDELWSYALELLKNLETTLDGCWRAEDSQEAEFKKLLKIENWEVPIVEVTYSDAIF